MAEKGTIVKPIGIMTFHRASNYGAVLQAYALQRAFHNNGCEAIIVNYLNKTVEEDHRPSGLFRHHSPLSAALRYPIKEKKDRLFNEFRDRKLKMSEELVPSDLAHVRDRYSAFVAGSDQVWNDRFSGLDPAYMLTFAYDHQRYSYACSLGFDKFPEGTAEKYREYLKGMKCISLREESAAPLLSSIGLESRIDVDPTLLLTREDWTAFAQKPDRKEPYILIYTVNKDVHLIEYARRLSEKTGCRIVYLNNQMKSNRDIPRVRYSTPEEFVGWFESAEYVLTNSFHGTVFAILFNRKCRVELETAGKFNVRSQDLLRKCGLDSCILGRSGEDLFSPDWENANECLSTLKEQSAAYIRSIIEAAQKCGEIPDLCEDASKCCGCGGCRSVCPANAITMREDAEGFLYPVIDPDKCVRCLRCLQACAFKKDLP